MKCKPAPCMSTGYPNIMPVKSDACDAVPVDAAPKISLRLSEVFLASICMTKIGLLLYIYKEK